MMQSCRHSIAQASIGCVRHPLKGPRRVGISDTALAQGAGGLVWRVPDDHGDTTGHDLVGWHDSQRRHDMASRFSDQRKTRRAMEGLIVSAMGGKVSGMAGPKE